MKLIFLSLYLIVFYLHTSEANLYVQGNNFYYNKQQVFLSGSNAAWVNYANDFGSGAYWNVQAQYEQMIDDIANNGGNAFRVWVHTSGDNCPKWGGGYATGQDTDSLISELGALLDKAKSRNVFVILTLFNLAASGLNDNVKNMFFDQGKRNTYFEKVLKPMAQNLSGKPALAAIEIINEPGGSLVPASNSNPCLDTSQLKSSGINWAGNSINVNNVQTFINQAVAAIKSVAGNILCTVGEWSEKATTNPTSQCPECRNYWSDQCLRAAGGQYSGVLDFYQIHTYINPSTGKYNPASPMNIKSSAYGLGKPVIVGEFATICSESPADPVGNYKRLYNNQFAGILNWQYNEQNECADKQWMANQGMTYIKGQAWLGNVQIQM